MPELAFFFLIGSTMSLLLSLFFIYFNLRVYKTDEYKLLQETLNQQGARWNDLNSSVEPLSSDVDQQLLEERRAFNTCVVIALAATVLSWFGFLFLILIWVSLKYLIKSKLPIN